MTWDGESYCVELGCHEPGIHEREIAAGIVELVCDLHRRLKVCAAVLTYQAYTFDRIELLERTLDGLDEADEIYLVDNGSNDGTEQLVAEFGGFVNRTDLHTSGHGTNLCARILAGTDADICVLSDDDIAWRPGWRAALEAWWTDAPDAVALTGCHIEPLFHWNEVLGLERYGGIPGLVRASSGAATWSYRARHHEAIFGPSGIPQQLQGYGDVPACDRLRERGYRICQIDLATHEGNDRSTWGNQTVERWGWDLQPALDLLAAVPS